MREFAAAEHKRQVQNLYEAMGSDGTLKAFVHYPANTFPGQPDELKDDTHFNAYGAYELARAIVADITRQHLPLAAFLRKDIPPFDPAHPDSLATWHLPAALPSPSTRPRTIASSYSGNHFIISILPPPKLLIVKTLSKFICQAPNPHNPFRILVTNLHVYPPRCDRLVITIKTKRQSNHAGIPGRSHLVVIPEGNLLLVSVLIHSIRFIRVKFFRGQNRKSPIKTHPSPRVHVAIHHAPPAKHHIFTTEIGLR
jgi:hypothetical protein